MVLNILTLVGSLSLFLYGLYALSAGMKKLLGDKLKAFVPWMSSSPLKQILSGTGMTASIITSKASTESVVSLVSAGVITISQAACVIMGANIGTTITAWIITFFGFSFNIAQFLFPLLGLGFVMTMLKNRKAKQTGELLINFALIVLGIGFALSTISDIDSSTALGGIIGSSIGDGFGMVLLFVLAGIFFAAILQSSISAIVLGLIALSIGWIDFHGACAIAIGANIGTTINKILLSQHTDLQARKAAFIHLCFNVSVALVVLVFFYPFTAAVRNLVCLVLGTETTLQAFMASGNAALYGVCIFHTLFNTVGTCILVWFVPFIVRTSNSIFKEKPSQKESYLKYTASKPIGAPAFSITQAMHEVVRFGKLCQDGFKYVRLAINEPDGDKFEEYRMKLVGFEELSDKMQFGIANFLDGVTSDETSPEEDGQLRILFRIISEMESLGDSGENVSRILERERVHNMKFDATSIMKMNLMIDLVDEALRIMVHNLETACGGALSDISNAYKAEDDINTMRNTLRNEAMNSVEMREGNYQSTNYFLDIISELEAMGDFIINISQAAAKTFE